MSTHYYTLHKDDDGFRLHCKLERSYQSDDGASGWCYELKSVQVLMLNINEEVSGCFECGCRADYLTLCSEALVPLPEWESVEEECAIELANQPQP